MTVARRTPKRMNAHLRLQTNAVWDVAIFVLNVLAFILAGLQLRPILVNLGGADWRGHAAFGAAILIVCIGVRMAWVMSITATLRGLNHSRRPRQRRPLYVPSLGGSVIVSWCGMRGVVTLATALALPEDPGVFPFRDVVLFAAFAVVLGTLVVQPRQHRGPNTRAFPGRAGGPTMGVPQFAVRCLLPVLRVDCRQGRVRPQHRRRGPEGAGVGRCADLAEPHHEDPGPRARSIRPLGKPLARHPHQQRLPVQ